MRKKVLTVLVAALLGVGVGAMLGYGPLLRYKSDGVLGMEMSTSEYKRFAELANNSATLRQFSAVVSPPGLDSREIDQLIDRLDQGDWQKPVPKVSKADAKELPDILLQMEKTRDTPETQTAYLGVRLTSTASDPAQAAAVATWLGNYFKDVAARETVRNLAYKWSAESRKSSDRAIERKLKYAFDIEQAQTRATALKKVVAAYPNLEKHEAQQVVDVRKDNEKFMSPLAQLVGAESEIISIREQVAVVDRELEQQAFAKALVGDAVTVVDQARSGSASILKLAEVIGRFSKQVKTEAEREKLSTMAAELSQISARFLLQARFFAEPSVPNRPERPRPLMVMVLAGLLAGFFVAVFAWRETLMRVLSQHQDTAN